LEGNLITQQGQPQSGFGNRTLASVGGAGVCAEVWIGSCLVMRVMHVAPNIRKTAYRNGSLCTVCNKTGIYRAKGRHSVICGHNTISVL